MKNSIFKLTTIFAIHSAETQRSLVYMRCGRDGSYRAIRTWLYTPTFPHNIIHPLFRICNAHVTYSFLVELRWLLNYSRFPLRLNIAYCVTACGRNFLRVAGSFTETTRPGIRKGLEAMQALCVSVILAEHSFRDNPRNTQCSNATEIDCNLEPVRHYLSWHKMMHSHTNVQIEHDIQVRQPSDLQQYIICKHDCVWGPLEESALQLILCSTVVLGVCYYAMGASGLQSIVTTSRFRILAVH